MRLNGKISISRDTKTDKVHIELTDKTSRCRVVDVEMTAEDFGKAVTGLSDLPCVFEYSQKDKIGKQHEYKAVLIPLSELPEKSNLGKIKEKIKVFEVDGWTARDAESELTNLHSIRYGEGGKNFLEVGFDRWVDPAGEGSR